MAITAGASAPEHLVEELIDYLRASGYSDLEEAEIKEEDVRFTLPADLESFCPEAASCCDRVPKLLSAR